MIAQLRAHQKREGSVLVLTAAIMLVLVALGMLLLGISYRANQIQRTTTTLREATRTAAQQWNYAGFAKNTPVLNDRVAIDRAHEILMANINSIPGRMQNKPINATWTIVTSGSCGSIQVTRPSVCGSLTIFVSSLPLGFPGGAIPLTVQSVSTIDVGTK